MNVVLTIPTAARQDVERVPDDPFACPLLAPSVCTEPIEQQESIGFYRAFRSGASRDRTGDLLLAKQALSQLSYGPFAG